MAWYEEAFQREYLLVYPHRDEAAAAREVEFAIRTCELKAPARVLDLCCGYGRHAAILAKKGFQVFGCDLSPDLLQHFAKRLGGLPARLGIVRGDARRQPFRAESFQSVFCFFQSFGYFEAPSEDAHVIEEASRVLVTGGRFLLDLMNPEHAIAHLEPVTVSAAAGMKMIQRRSYDAVRGKIVKTITLSVGDGPPRRWQEEVRLYRKESLEELLAASRFRLIAWYGDFDGRPFGSDTPRLIALAEKKR